MENVYSLRTEQPQDKQRNRRKKQSQFHEVWGRLKKNKRAMVALSVIVLLFSLAIFADLIANYNSLVVRQDMANRLLFPNSDHIFGTDLYGRDIFARIVHGTRIALILGFGATSISIIVATIIGSTAAYFGGRFDYIVTRIVDTLLAIPSLLLALALVASIGSGLIQLVIAISLGQIANFIRIIRSAALTVVNLEFIEAGKALGASHSWIILRYVIPNIIGIVLIQGAMQVSMNILMGATLSFVGLGVQVPTPEWGAMLAEGLSYMQYRPYLVIIPGIFLMITAFSINTFGDCLRDAFDPRLKGKS